MEKCIVCSVVETGLGLSLIESDETKTKPIATIIDNRELGNGDDRKVLRFIFEFQCRRT